jgi:hypothetical protein
LYQDGYRWLFIIPPFGISVIGKAPPSGASLARNLFPAIVFSGLLEVMNNNSEPARGTSSSDGVRLMAGGIGSMKYHQATDTRGVLNIPEIRE